MSTLNHNTAECETVVQRLLEINIETTHLLAHMNQNGDVHVDPDVRHISLSEQNNAFALLHPDVAIMSLNLDLDENTGTLNKDQTCGILLEKKHELLVVR